MNRLGWYDPIKPEGRGWPDGIDQPKKKVNRNKRNPSKKNKVAKLRLIFWQIDPHCSYCGIQLVLEEATLDHKIPRSKGGRTTLTNTCLSCHKCNNEKGDSLDWRPGGANQ